MRKTPALESFFINQLIAGFDEVGRGAISGPLVAAMVVLCPKMNFNFKDSKQLTLKQRLQA
jgi:ribonuclease HII